MRVSTSVLALLCLVTGYALAGNRVKALEDGSQVRRLPGSINVGAHVHLWFSSDPKLADCTIDRMDAGWVRCAPPDRFGPPPTGQPDEVWYDLAHVVYVQKIGGER